MDVDRDTIRTTTEVDTDAQPTEASRKLDDTLLRWLDGLSCLAKQEETLSLRQPDTCTWLLSTAEYQSWRNGDHALLWLNGKPGSGKTILASFVVDTLMQERGHGEALAYCYCDFRRDRSTSAVEVMRSILSQFLCHIRRANAVPRELANIVVKDKGSTLCDVWQLAAFVLQTVKRLTDRPLIVVDGLDECKDLEMLLCGLLALAEGGVQLFVTSRPLQTIKDRLRSFPAISMDDKTQQDIALHIERELKSRLRLKDLESDVKTEIHAALCAKADGMFRWIQCQMDVLDRCATGAEVQDALNNLPAGLNETYEQSLVAIDISSPKGVFALRVMTLLVGALRPLRSREIIEALSIETGKWTTNYDAGSIHKDALLEACGSLVTYNEGTDVLLLSHSSVKEYLTSDLTRIKLPQYHISYQSAHELLARLCIRYLTLHLKHVHESGGNTTSSQFPSGLSDGTPAFGLVAYVFSHGFDHLAYLGLANHVVLNDLVALELVVQQYPTSWKGICGMSRIPSVPERHDFMSYVLIAFSSPSFFRAFLRAYPIPKHQTNPLLYAVHFNKLQHAEILLSHGTSANEPGWVVDAHRLASPLEIAIGRRKEEMVQLFLSAGGTVPKRLFALSTYYRNYHFRLVRILLETDDFLEWALEPRNELPSPLRILEQHPSPGLQMDIIRIIRRLLQVGVDLAEQDSFGKTALDFAVLGGYNAIVLYLLTMGGPRTYDLITIVSKVRPSEQIPMLRSIIEVGFDVKCDLPGDDTPLHLAVTSSLDDCLEVIKILVAAGCDPFARNAEGKTPLHFALEQGNAIVADYILAQGTPPSDVLIAVVESKCTTRWRLDTVCALVNNGVDMGGITTHVNSLLSQARASYSPSGTAGYPYPTFAIDPSLIADYLIDARQLPPPSALFSVLQSGLPNAWKTLIVYSLVGKGVDVRMPSYSGNTLLHVAMSILDERAGLEVARYLVDAGGDPFQFNNRGQTPLHIVLDRSFPLVAEYLLSTGDPLPPFVLHTILCSSLPTNWRVRTTRAFTRRGDVRALSTDGNTLIHDAVATLGETEALDMARFLIEAGCELSVSNQKGEMALHIASEKGYISVIEYILSLDTSLPDDILFSVLKSHSDIRVNMIMLFIGEWSNVGRAMKDGANLLHAALSSLSSRLCVVPRKDMADREFFTTQIILEILVEHGCDAFAHDAQHQTPLHLAVTSGYVPIVKYLLSIPTRPSLPTDILIRAPDWEALHTNWEDTRSVLRLLVENGAPIDGRDADGNTLLHMVINFPRTLSLRHRSWTAMLGWDHACDFDWAESQDSDLLQMVKMFVDAGCDPLLCDAGGRSPVYAAIVQGHADVVEYLLPSAVQPLEDLEGAVEYAPGDARVRLRELLESERFEQQILYEIASRGVGDGPDVLLNPDH